MYWAVLRVCYEHADEPVSVDDLVKSIDALMRDRDEQWWNQYQAKQGVKPWQVRVVDNAKTLTRRGGAHPYGMRLIERGHVLNWHSKPKPHFILVTDAEMEG